MHLLTNMHHKYERTMCRSWFPSLTTQWAPGIPGRSSSGLVAGHLFSLGLLADLQIQKF